MASREYIIVDTGYKNELKDECKFLIPYNKIQKKKYKREVSININILSK